ncbi:hypothetical protein [Streptomyces sp. WM6386]|uniref:hypothetical protein n=1 Tax=Streptomyces sp. WM6386 TaxID=1415558 RepID=UPI000ABD3343|nr:hypothetical protein [Streptomyces sp. WM6386]
MATLRNMRERTITFFEIVKPTSGEPKRMEQIDWDGALSDVSQLSAPERKVEAENIWVGTVTTVDTDNILLLHRVKDSGEWLSVLNWDTGDLRELEQSAHEGYLDTSVIYFLPFGNIVAVMPGSVSAPGRPALESWINGMKIFPHDLLVRPVIAHAEVEKLRTAEGASRVEVKVMANKMGALREKKGGLAHSLRIAGEAYGEISVTMIISVPRKKELREHREMLLADLRAISDVVPEAERARAKLVYSDPTGPEYSRLVELVDHHITAKRRVAATDDEGNSIRILSAVHAILGASAEHEDELRLAVDSVEAT